jgi:hypothetical protein
MRHINGNAALNSPAQSRRDFVSQSLALAGCALPVTSVVAAERSGAPEQSGASHQSGGAGLSAAGEITAETIQEAEKLHGVHFSAAQRGSAAEAAPAQAATIEALRKVSRPLWLRPALSFDPRLPGERYLPQKNDLRLAAADAVALPRDDASIAYAPVTQLAAWIKARQLSSSRLTEIYL